MTASSEPPAKRVAFFSTVTPGDTPRLDTMLGYALAAAATGYETKIFFALDSALVTKNQVFQKLEPKLQERLRDCVRDGVQLDICSASAQTFNIKPEDLIPGVKIKGIASFFDFAETTAFTLSWS